MIFPITDILTPKLFVPPQPPKAVRRPRLTERLNEVLCQGQRDGRKLILISAPAGFGKTTLVSEWVEGCARRVAWLSLDEGDSDPVRFLTYLVAALRTAAPELGEGVLRALQSPQPPALEVMLTALLNETTRLPEGCILILDDYHAIDAQTIDAALTFLIEHLPPQMRLVITTREDPRLPLARLRARGQLIELRAGDLRFTPAEAAGFLQSMRLNLSPEDVAALQERTEGWIAGLQLAALALQGRQDSAGDNSADRSEDMSEDISAFIQAFAGDHRYIVDYLVEEVLQRQPEPVRNFLLQTAILERLSGPLCDAVTDQEGSQQRLEALERGNFFVVPLDDQRRWYRYHHLFADVLYARLMAEQPEHLAILHRRASEWYERNGSPAAAIRHALEAKDFERAADLIERAMPVMRRSRQEATMLGWLQALPEELYHHRPVLSVNYAGFLLASGLLEGVEARLRDAERWLGAPGEAGNGATGAERVVMDEEEFRRLPGWIAIYRAAMGLALGDAPHTLKYGRQALGLLHEADSLGHGAAAGLLGLAYWTSGELEAARLSYDDGIASLQEAGHLSDAAGLSIALADIHLTQGRLREATRTYERGLQLVTEQAGPILRGAADMLVGMSEVFRERNELESARQCLLRSQELGEHNGLPQNPHRWRVAMARIQAAQGQMDEALDLLQEAERRYNGDLFPNVRPIAAWKARMWATQGRVDEALDWAREQGLSAQDDLSYRREFEHITLARALLARQPNDRANGSTGEAARLLERLLHAAEAGKRTGSVIEILALQALAFQMQANLPAALAALERALGLAEPEGYVRIFVDEGPPMAALLEKAAAQGKALDYVRRLQAAFGLVNSRTPEPQALPGPEARPAPDMLLEPLSERELEVLRLLGTELNGPEIARELIVSLNTLRTHTKNIYSKLGVNNRLAAVRRAEALDLL